MIHWTWQKTKLQPSFTGHGMYSGTGFITKEGKAAGIYCGVSDPRQTFIVTAEDDNLNVWNKPYPVLPKGGPDGKDMRLAGDPDLFTVGKTYYAYSASDDVQLCKSQNLIDWEYVGPLMRDNFPGVVIGEDLSCSNMFPFYGKWMLLNISHFLGCRYYIGDWDAKVEQFVPEMHGRMNWRRPDQSLKNPENDALLMAKTLGATFMGPMSQSKQAVTMLSKCLSFTFLTKSGCFFLKYASQTISHTWAMGLIQDSDFNLANPFVNSSIKGIRKTSCFRIKWSKVQLALNLPSLSSIKTF